MDALPQSVSQKLRMAGRDYSRRGWVFVTLNADYHRHLFGEINGDTSVMVCNALGRLVADEWARIPTYFSEVRLGAYQVMPNHFHGLIWLSGFQTVAQADSHASGLGKIVSLGEIINPFKGGVTRKWRRVLSLKRETTRETTGKTTRETTGKTTRETTGKTTRETTLQQTRETTGQKPVSVWQPNYWDVICFTDEELATKEAYIRANPLRWALKRVPRGVIPEGRYFGNLSLLTAAPKRVLRISRRATASDIEKALDAVSSDGVVVVSTFFSPGERSVLSRVLARDDIRLIWLVPMSLPTTVPVKWSAALASGRALWLSAFTDETPDASRTTCEHCNAWAQRLVERP